MSSDGQDRNQKATPQRMKEVRKKGGLGRSHDLPAWAGVGAGMLMLPGVISRAGAQARLRLVALADVANHPTPARALAQLHAAGGSLIAIMAPMFAVIVVVVIVVNVAQGGVHPVLRLHADSLNPAKGAKRLVSPTTLWEAGKTLAKSVAVGLVVFATLRTLVPTLIGSGQLPLAAVLAIAGGSAQSLARAGVVAGLALAVVDLVVVVRRNRKQTRMTLREVQEENKRTEGDPKIKGAIRSRQRAMSRNRMMAAVTDADVVVVNPTHLAVALRYEPGSGAPKVVAKGQGVVAQRIKELAAQHRVPMIADVPLARSLYAACEVDQEIPEYLFMAVARVLAFVMALRRRGAAAGEHRSPGGTALPQYDGADHRAVAREHARAAQRRRHRAAAPVDGLTTARHGAPGPVADDTPITPDPDAAEVLA